MCGETVRRESGELNSCYRQEELGEILLGQQPYRMVKTLRDMSMAEKRGTGEHTRSVAAQDPRNKVKAALPEPQTPVMERAHPQPRYVRAVLAE